MQVLRCREMIDKYWFQAESEKLVGGLFEESSDGEMVPPPAARVPMVAPDAGFVNMLRYGMLALRLLPESSCKSEFKIKFIRIELVYFNNTMLTNER